MSVSSKDVTSMSIEEISKEIEKLTQKSLERKLDGKGIIRLKSLKREIEERKSKDEKQKGKSRAEGVFVSGDRLVNIPIENIEFPDFQDRSGMEEDEILKLKESIAEIGLIQPIVVSRLSGGKYLKVAGRRRIEAAKRLGWREIPAIVREEFVGGDDTVKLFLQILHENALREGVNPYDMVRSILNILSLSLGLKEKEVISLVNRAANYKKGNLHDVEPSEIERFDAIDSILKKTGTDWKVSTLANRLQVLSMPEALTRAMVQNRIGFKMAETIYRYWKKGAFEDLEKIISEVVEKGYSIRDVSDLAKALLARKKKKTTLEKEAEAVGKRLASEIRKLKRRVESGKDEEALARMRRALDALSEK